NCGLDCSFASFAFSCLASFRFRSRYSLTDSPGKASGPYAWPLSGPSRYNRRVTFGSWLIPSPLFKDGHHRGRRVRDGLLEERLRHGAGTTRNVYDIRDPDARDLIRGSNGPPVRRVPIGADDDRRRSRLALQCRKPLSDGVELRDRPCLKRNDLVLAVQHQDVDTPLID